MPLNTYVRPGTQQRVEVLKDRGYAVTDIVDAALNEFLDRAGVTQAEQPFTPPHDQIFRCFLVVARLRGGWWLSRLDRRSTALRRLPALTVTTHRFATIEAEEDERAQLKRFSVIAL